MTLITNDMVAQLNDLELETLQKLVADEIHHRKSQHISKIMDLVKRDASESEQHQTIEDAYKKINTLLEHID